MSIEWVNGIYDGKNSDMRLLPGPDEDTLVATVNEMLADVEARVHGMFHEALLPETARSFSSEVMFALHQAGLSASKVHCSKGIVTVANLWYNFPPVPLDTTCGWNLHVRCMFVDGKVTKTGRGNVMPTLFYVVLRVEHIMKVSWQYPKTQYPSASLWYAKAPLMDSRPVLRAFRRVARDRGYETTDHERPDEAPWALRLWRGQEMCTS